MTDPLQIADLEKAKKHNTFHVEVASGKEGGLATGADIDYATNAVTGQVQKTLPATIRDLDWSYVGKFADGVTFTKQSDFALDASNTQWIYVGASPFPVVVPPATVPSSPDYQVVHVSDHNQLSGRNDVGAHDAAAISQSTPLGSLAGQTIQTLYDESNNSARWVIGDGSNETTAFVAMLDYAKTNGGRLTINDPQSVYVATLPSTASAISKAEGGQYQWDGSRWFDVTPVRETYVIYVSNVPGDINLAIYPPRYDSLASAMASITDNSRRKPYRIEMLSGTHDASQILLKDYVDIVRSPLASNTVIIEHDFLPSDSFKIRDIFKTANTPYDATDTFPIRCKIEGLYIRGQNLNYCVHADFNDHPELDIEINDCILFNGDDATTATTADYAFGVGIYGGQRIVCNRTLFYGRYDAALPIERQQGSGWIVHNRAAQTRPCYVGFNDCKSLKGFYGGRIVDYGSGQEDIISINGGVLKGELGNLLCFSNGLPGTVPSSLTVVGNVPVSRVALQQQINVGGTIYKCEFPIVIAGFSELYINGEVTALETGDLVTLNAYGTKATKTSTSIRYKYAMGGVVINPAAPNGRVAVQKSGVAAAKFSGASISSNTEVSNSSTEAGKIQAAVAGDGVFGATVVSTGFSTGVTAGLAWININYGGTK